MTIRELLAVLAAFPIDTRVIVDGYEGGFEDASAYLLPVVLDYRCENGLLGPHDVPLHADSDKASTDCLLISRYDEDVHL